MNLTNDTAVTSALEVMNQHISALNAADADKLTATLHFPHIRLSGTTVKTWESPDQYMTDFFNRAGAEWGYSKFSEIKAVQSAHNKVHLDVLVRRFRTDNTLLIEFRSLWVIVEINGVWGAKLRSSFAPL